MRVSGGLLEMLVPVLSHFRRLEGLSRSQLSRPRPGSSRSTVAEDKIEALVQAIDELELQS
ncbi:hypothetical protein MMC07_001995, partial [Pseudocyphellaria aurata]|nr:hypothetical protein [Pseudocyphellaria aurata]